MTEIDDASALLKSLDARAYYERFLAVGLYPDGREIGQFRPISLQLNVVSRSFASALMRLGNATALCSIDIVVTSTLPQHRADLIVIHIDAGSNIDRAELELVEHTLRQLIVVEAFVRFDTLIQGRLAFVLHVYLAVLNADGAIIDACVGAVSAALCDVRLPTLIVDDDDLVGDIEMNRVRVDREKQHRRLESADIPVCCTLMLIRDGRLLCDPNAELMTAMSGARCQLIVGNDRRIYSANIDCNGDQETVTGDHLDVMVNVAIERRCAVVQAIHELVVAK